MESEQEVSESQTNIATITKKKKRKKLLLIPLFVLIICGIIYGYNFFSLQYPMNKILLLNGNKGIDVSVGYENYINLSTVIYDLHGCQHKTKIDILKVLLQFAEKKKDSNFDYIILCCRGKRKFIIPGEFFKKIGMEYNEQNIVPTIKMFPENLLHLDGSPFSETKSDSLFMSEDELLKECCKFMFEWLKSD